MDPSNIIAALALVISVMALAVTWRRTSASSRIATEANRIAREALQLQKVDAEERARDRRLTNSASVAPGRMERDWFPVMNSGAGAARSVFVYLKEGELLKEGRRIASIAPGQTSYASDFRVIEPPSEERAYLADRSGPARAAKIRWLNEDDTLSDSGWQSV